ncbi:MAG TPA: hypothetical protein VJ438_04730 [Candidatus Nanoarchaeia archaeon]|nr:hypothetical protein [Candidatus Nanoarchaeia archaeon]
MNKFEKKYNIIKTKETKKYHLSRRMFCIVDDKLYIAEPNLSYSHAVWFEKQKWISHDNNEEFMNKVVRGIVYGGDIYFYSGYDFIINKKIESIFFPYLKQLVNQLGLSANAKVYGGFERINPDEKMTPRKFFGRVKELIN